MYNRRNKEHFEEITPIVWMTDDSALEIKPLDKPKNKLHLIFCFDKIVPDTICSPKA